MNRIQIEGLSESTNQTVDINETELFPQDHREPYRTKKRKRKENICSYYMNTSKIRRTERIHKLSNFCTGQTHKPHEFKRPSRTIQEKEEKAKV